MSTKTEKPQPITERIKTFEDVLAANNLTREQFDQEWSGRADYDIATEQTRLIALALNEGVEMKTADTNQVKYYPWFWVNPNKDKPSGFGLSCHCYDCSLAHSGRGARLCLKSDELAEYAGTQFTEIYERAHV